MIRIVGWGILTACDCHDVAGFRLVIKMQHKLTELKLSQHIFDATLHGRIVGAVSGDELLDDRSERGCRKF